MSEPIKIHPFDVYRLLMEGDRNMIVQRACEAQQLPNNQLVINGILYEQSTEILKVIG